MLNHELPPLPLMLSIQVFVFNPFAENTYVVSDDTRETVIIDPGCSTKEEQRELVSYIDSQQLKVKYVLNTHGHIDHVLGNDFVKDKYKSPLVISKLDEATMRSVKAYASLYGFDAYREAEPDKFLSEGDSISFGKTLWKIFFLPGHSPGHIGF